MDKGVLLWKSELPDTFSLQGGTVYWLPLTGFIALLSIRQSIQITPQLWILYDSMVLWVVIKSLPFAKSVWHWMPIKKEEKGNHFFLTQVWLSWFSAWEKLYIVKQLKHLYHSAQKIIRVIFINLFFPIVLRNNRHMSLYKLKVYSVMVWFTYIVLWLPQ